MSNKLLDILEDIADVLEAVDTVTDVVSGTVKQVPDVIDAFTESKDNIKEVVEEEVDNVKEAIKESVPMNLNFFSDRELASPDTGTHNMDAGFLAALNLARFYAGNPWIVNSAYRTEAHNAAVGGVADSSHTKGLAVDISATTCQKKFEIILNALKVGINRIGISDTFVHLDADTTKTPNCVFLY